MEQEQTQPTTAVTPEPSQPEAVATATEESRPTPEADTEQPSAAADTPRLTETDALTAARLMELLSQAEERGYMRARREMATTSERDVPLWGNPRRIEAEATTERDKMKIGDDFLTRIRPAVWD